MKFYLRLMQLLSMALQDHNEMNTINNLLE